MILTSIDKTNAKAFRPLFGGVYRSTFALCVGAIEDDRAAGVAAYSAMGDSLFLDYIYVAPEFRRRGIGTALLEETIAEFIPLGLAAVHVNYPEASEDIHKFILARGFRIFRDGKAYRVKAGDLISSATAKKFLSGSIRHRVVEVSALTVLEKKSIKQSLRERDLDPKVIDEVTFDKELSLVTLDKKDRKPAGMVLCDQSGDTIVVSYLVNFSDDPVMLLDILIALKDRIIQKDLSDHHLLFLTLTDDMIVLPIRLLETKDLLMEVGNVVSGIRMFTGQWE